MPATDVLLIRHAMPQVDASTSPSTWPLADEGRAAAARLGSTLAAVLDGRAVVASTEVKAVETAAVVAGIDVADVRASSAFGEVRRPFVETGHADAVGRYLAGEVIPGWEPLEDAVARFRSGLDALDGPVAVATHGTIVSAVIQSLIPNVDGREFWAHLAMPDAWLLDLRTAELDRVATFSA